MIALGAPSMHSYVRSISSCRHCVSTWIVTSSGIRSSVMILRMKSKSGWLAAGKPTSISLKPIRTTSSNIRILRVGSIGSMSAWLPSRRSTEHHSGALSMTTLGHVRSWRTIGTEARYLSNGILGGVELAGGMSAPVRVGGSAGGGWGGCAGPKNEEPPGRFGGGCGRTQICDARPTKEGGGRCGESSRPTYRTARANGNWIRQLDTARRRRHVDRRVAGRRLTGGTARYRGRIMIDPSARPGGRRNAPRRRRPPRRPTDHRERSVAGNGDAGSSSGNLTTINLLPPVEAPTGFADLGVPERIDIGLAAAGFAQPFAIQTEAIPVALAGSRRVRPGRDRFRQDAGLRCADARPHHRCGRAARPARSRARADARARHPGRRGARPGRQPRPACGCCAVYGGASRHQQIEALARGRRARDRHAAAPDRPVEVERGRPRQRPDRRASTRPTAWPTTASRRRSSGSCATAPAAARRCCSRPRSTATSVTSSATTSPIRSRSRSTPPPTPSARCTTSSWRCTTWTRTGWSVPSPRASPRSSCSARPSACATGSTTALARSRRQRRGDPRRPPAAVARAGDASLRRGQAARCSSPPTSPPAASTSTTSASVIHYEPAKDGKDYLHRSGRTARAGRDGWAITLVEYNQHTQMRILQRALRLAERRRRSRCSRNNPKLRDLTARSDADRPRPTRLSAPSAVDARQLERCADIAGSLSVAAARPGGWPRSRRCRRRGASVMPTSSRPSRNRCWVVASIGNGSTSPDRRHLDDEALDVDDDLGLRVGVDRGPDRLDRRLRQHDRRRARSWRSCCGRCRRSSARSRRRSRPAGSPTRRARGTSRRRTRARRRGSRRRRSARR